VDDRQIDREIAIWRPFGGARVRDGGDGVIYGANILGGASNPALTWVVTAPNRPPRYVIRSCFCTQGILRRQEKLDRRQPQAWQLQAWQEV